MKKKILVIIICALFFTTTASFTATAAKPKINSQNNIIKQNSPPDIPTVEIPENVVRGHWLYIKTSTIDPDNDNVYYKFDIGGHDYGWVGPFQSGKEHIEMVLLLIPIGTYTLGVQAKDTFDAESDWSYTLFNVIKSKSAISPFLNFLQNHPHFYSFIQRFFKL